MKFTFHYKTKAYLKLFLVGDLRILIIFRISCLKNTICVFVKFYSLNIKFKMLHIKIIKKSKKKVAYTSLFDEG